jgi:hypothetical protein
LSRLDRIGAGQRMATEGDDRSGARRPALGQFGSADVSRFDRIGAAVSA